MSRNFESLTGKAEGFLTNSRTLSDRTSASVTRIARHVRPRCSDAAALQMKLKSRFSSRSEETVHGALVALSWIQLSNSGSMPVAAADTVASASMSLGGGAGDAVKSFPSKKRTSLAFRFRRSHRA